MSHFCTYFDSFYLSRGLSLIQSLEQHCPEFSITVLCLDDRCLDRIAGLGRQHIEAMSLDALEQADPELKHVKHLRNKLEYYYTCGPAFIREVMTRHTGQDVVTYLDADLFFLSDPQSLLDAFQGHSIGVIGHHLPSFRKNVKSGIYNVGWISFRRDQDGMACLARWRAQCIDWCYERYEDGKYCDQLYLDEWPRLYKGFYEFTHHGANVAAWNVGDYRYSVRDGRVFVDEDPFIFYHFHGFKRITANVYNANLFKNWRPPHPVLKRYVFEPYIASIEANAGSEDPTASIRLYRPKYHHLKLAYRCLIGLVFHQFICVDRRRSAPAGSETNEKGI
jgi:hypothetical protein